jgi:hypothetical protein
MFGGVRVVYPVNCFDLPEQSHCTLSRTKGRFHPLSKYRNWAATRQRDTQLPTRTDPELGKHIVQMPFHRPWTDE